MNKDDIIVENQALIKKVIKDMHLHWNTEDEWQNYYDDGLIGLINGVRSYDEKKGIMLSTYLYACIKRQIVNGIVKSFYDKRRLNKEQMYRLDKELTNDSDTTYLDLVKDKNVNIEQEVENKLMYEEIIKALDYIEPKYYVDMFCKFYGVNGYEKMSLEAIGKEYGCKKQNVFDKIQRTQNKIIKIINGKKVPIVNKRR